MAWIHEANRVWLSMECHHWDNCPEPALYKSFRIFVWSHLIWTPKDSCKLIGFLGIELLKLAFSSLLQLLSLHAKGSIKHGSWRWNSGLSRAVHLLNKLPPLENMRRILGLNCKTLKSCPLLVQLSLNFYCNLWFSTDCTDSELHETSHLRDSCSLKIKSSNAIKQSSHHHHDNYHALIKQRPACFWIHGMENPQHAQSVGTEGFPCTIE